MATYVFGLTYSDVLAAIGRAPTSTNASPNSTQISTWITAFAADLGLILRPIVGDPSTVTTAANDELFQLCKAKIVQRVVAEWHIANKREVSEYDQHLLDEWDAFKDDLRKMPTFRVGVATNEIGPRFRSDTAVTSLDLIDPNFPKLWVNQTNGFG